MDLLKKTVEQNILRTHKKNKKTGGKINDWWIPWRKNQIDQTIKPKIEIQIIHFQSCSTSSSSSLLLSLCFERQKPRSLRPTRLRKLRVVGCWKYIWNWITGPVKTVEMWHFSQFTKSFITLFRVYTAQVVTRYPGYLLNESTSKYCHALTGCWLDLPSCPKIWGHPWTL